LDVALFIIILIICYLLQLSDGSLCLYTVNYVLWLKTCTKLRWQSVLIGQ